MYINIQTYDLYVSSANNNSKFENVLLYLIAINWYIVILELIKVNWNVIIHWSWDWIAIECKLKCNNNYGLFSINVFNITSALFVQ